MAMVRAMALAMALAMAMAMALAMAMAEAKALAMAMALAGAKALAEAKAMGAVDFYTEGEGPTLQKAFNKAVEEAQYEHGHGGYTGTIAEKQSVKLVGTVDSTEQAHELAYKLIEDEDPRVDDKWGPAGAIQIAGTNKYLFFGNASS